MGSIISKVVFLPPKEIYDDDGRFEDIYSIGVVKGKTIRIWKYDKGAK